MFNILIDDLPRTVEVDGVEVPIRCQTNVSIAISLLDEEKVFRPGDADFALETAVKQLSLFYPVIPGDEMLALQRLIEFYSYTPLAGAQSREGRPQTSLEQHKRNFSFKYDGGLIYSAFLQQYGIRGFDELHWFEFQALLEGLTDETQFIKAIQFRTMQITKEMSKAEKAYYRKMKRRYALPDERPQEVRDAAFGSLFE
ncbi:MAG: bacteriophage Gp15 family protein [Oscillospiraceae bacterium]|nr:bacteriophage Gp15 family protein [Oscillospiraceae bacterium]